MLIFLLCYTVIIGVYTVNYFKFKFERTLLKIESETSLPCFYFISRIFKL